MHRALLLTCAAFVLAACADDVTAPKSAGAPRLSVSGTEPSSYIIDFSSASLPKTLATDIRDAGGTLTAAYEGIGVAVASSADPSFAARATKIAGVRGVDPDLIVQWVEPVTETFEVTVDQAAVDEQSHQVGGHETFRRAQWAPDAVSAPAAWAAGAKGEGARVAILDGGIHSTHIDIQAQSGRPGGLDVARSASFVPGRTFNTDAGTFWHGTHVMGIVGALANNIGTVGIAPEATMIGVKVLHNGSGAFSWVMAGIVYAATPISEGGAGANIINLSLGASFPTNGNAHLKNALSKAVTYAYQRGVTVIAAAGNSAIDFDHTRNVIFVPAQSTHAIAVSALGPVGFALGATNFDRPASYTNFGQSAIELAGPGGDFVLPGNAMCSLPRIPTGTLTSFCWVFDMVLAPSRGSGTSNTTYSWAAGTSMASPAVAGVAALIVGRNPGISPADVREKLRASADDLGKPGNDDFYGRGRVNALRAIQ